MRIFWRLILRVALWFYALASKRLHLQSDMPYGYVPPDAYGVEPSQWVKEIADADRVSEARLA